MLHEAKDTTQGPQDQPLGQGEVSRLLGVIAGQIADADRRHFEALDEMKTRLQQLGADARVARPQVPHEFVPAFSRIEDALAQLAERISQARAERDGESLGTPAPSSAAGSATVSGEEELSAPAAASQPSQHGPMALRSGAAPAAAFNWSSEFSRNRTDPLAADPFDIIDNGGSTKNSEGWSAGDAEALTRLYEEDAANPPAPSNTFAALSELPAAPAEAAHVTPTATVHAFIAPSPAPEVAPAAALNFDRQWLEERFADLTDRLHASLDEAPVYDKLAALDNRLGQLEEHLGVSLQDVAKRTDVAGLKLVEAHIEEISRHLDQTQGQLNRLDTIEAQLNEVVEHLAAQFENHASAAAVMPAEEYQRMANEAAQSVASRFEGYMATSAASPAGTSVSSDDAVGDMRELLQSYIGERRDGDEHTALMLDTLQQALIRVLDRIDAMEQSRLPAAFAAAPLAHAKASPVERQRDTDPGFSGPDKRHSAAPFVPASVEDYEAPASLAAARQPDSFSEMKLPEQVDAPALPDGRAGVEKLRQDFVADAQRAKIRASAAKGEPGAPAGTALGAERVRRDVPTAMASQTKSRIGGLSPKLIVAALALIAVLGAGSLMRPKAPAPDAGEAPISQSSEDAETPAAPATAKAATPAAPTAANGKPESPDAAANSFIPDQDTDEARPAPGKISNDEPLSPPPGIRLRQSTDAVSPMNLVILQHQQNQANLSSQLGETAANTMTPAAFMQEVQIPGIARAVTSVPAPAETASTDAPLPADAKSSALDLPPITVGPLSLRLAAAKGDASAEFEAASRLAEGKGTSQNFKEAMRWYQRSAAQGFAQAQYRLGTLYERGLGVKADTGQARSWYQRAAEQGNVKAMHNLAVLSASRQTGSPDYETAAKWFRSAADRDLQDSQYNLGVLFESGLGVEKDVKQAMKWYSLAARGGDVQSIRRRDLIKAQLSPQEQTDAAQAVTGYEPIKIENPLVNDARAAGED